ncbi:MAG: FAD-dependent 5-carboxymethylaminomethyl-2-thiouridine(34) oxidoreductase MnmC, partial [Pseudohongiellaceae bacterium]
NRGWRVTILEQSDCIAADASGNDQAVLQCRLYRQADPPALLYLHAYLYAARQYHRLSRKMNFAWQNCGVLLLAEALNRKVRIEPALFEQVYSPRIARAMSAEAASALAGVSLAFPALFMPHGGWLNPRALCSAYVSHHDISVVNSCRVSRITQQSGVRVVHAAEQKYSADAVVIANSHQAVELEQTEFLPLQQLPGQVTTVQANDFSRKIRSVICGARYILPECNGNHTLGASYRLDAQDLARHKQEDVENLNRVREVMVTPEGLPAAVTAARVSSRCGSLDHLPSVGRLPGSASVGVYVNVAHGSLGLATTPLAAEYLASLLNDEDPPLDRVCESLLSPDRFIKRSGHPKRRIKPQCSAKSKRSKTYGTSG